MRLPTLLLFPALAAISFSACNGGGGRVPGPGATSFVSALAPKFGGSATAGTGGGSQGGGGSGLGTRGRNDRSIRRGDIYAVLGPDRLLNLNAWRGLQVVELDALGRPSISGGVTVHGEPVELHVDGDLAYLVLAGQHDHAARSGRLPIDGIASSSIVTVDLSNPSRPVVLDTEVVPGHIVTSRLLTEGARRALFVAAVPEALPANFDFGVLLSQADGGVTITGLTIDGDGDVETADTLDIPGAYPVVRGTTAALLVATSSEATSDVRVIGIDAAGHLTPGTPIRVAGSVRERRNLDLHDGVLRVASNRVTPSVDNHIETFDARDPSRPVPLDQVVFGIGESLFATEFLGHKAFAVTYRRVDPFHAFEIDAQGRITERLEFIVSGWNDYFEPVGTCRRLVGIGIDDAAGRAPAVSLYDITDLSNPVPLIARAHGTAINSWSEAAWDDRAFSVLEDAVDVLAPDGTRETGLVLLPFAGWDPQSSEHRYAAQLFSFSETTVTPRGTLDHGDFVRRSFTTDRDHAVTISDLQLRHWDTQSPDTPIELGRTELAPRVTAVLRVGDHGVRLVDELDRSSWWRDLQSVPKSVLEVFELGADPNAAPSLAHIEIPPFARVWSVGNVVVAIPTWSLDGSDGKLEVYDFSDPRAPRRSAALTWPAQHSVRDARAFGDALVLLRDSISAATGNSRLDVDVVDLRDPTAPTRRNVHRIPEGAIRAGSWFDSSSLQLGFAIPEDLTIRLPNARYYVQTVSLDDPFAPVVGAAHNVPGAPIAVDGNVVWTRDCLWRGSDGVIEWSVNRLRRGGDTAVLQRRTELGEQFRFDAGRSSDGAIIVAHARTYAYGNPAEPFSDAAVTVLEGDSLQVRSRADVAPFAFLREVSQDRAIIETIGGLLAIDTDGAAGSSLAWFRRAETWFGSGIEHDGHRLIPAGRYGVLRVPIRGTTPP